MLSHKINLIGTINQLHTVLSAEERLVNKVACLDDVSEGKSVVGELRKAMREQIV